MQDWWWVSGAVAFLSVCWFGASTPSPAIPVLARSSGHDLASLEARVASHPGDAQALTQLTDAYLDRSAPGLAEAALERAPAAVRAAPRVADARARTLSYLGEPALALRVQRSMLARCGQVHCTRALTAQAAQRAGWLAELVRMGVRDPERQPKLAMLAYRRSVREVELDVQ